MTTTAQLLTALRMSGRELIEACRRIPAAQFESGVYENGWNARQVLAHVASIEWTYPNLIEVATQPAQNGSGAPRRTAEGGIDAYNARQVEKRSSVPVAELVAEFERNRERTIRLIQEAPPDAFERPLTSAGGVNGRLGDVLLWVAAGHVRMHLQDIQGSADQ